MGKELPNEARVVIIGGGVIGASVAYHLAQLGWQEVVLLERKKLTSGTTWHAAGLMGQLRSSVNLTKLAKYTGELYEGLEQETGLATGYRKNGSISIATTEERLEELRRSASLAKVLGIEVEVVDGAIIAERYPIMNTSGVLGGLWIPLDGQLNPTDVTQSLIKGARQKGVRVFEDTRVTRICHDGGKVTGVETQTGLIQARQVVLCAGMWSRELAATAGVNVPLHACEHFYIVTEPIEGLPPNLPVLRDFDACTYFKEDAGKLLVGAFEPVAKPWGMGGIPAEFCFDELPPDLDHFEPVLGGGGAARPLAGDHRHSHFLQRPGELHAGRPIPSRRSTRAQEPVCCGWIQLHRHSVGRRRGQGDFRVDAGWAATSDLWDVDIRRNLPFQSNQKYLETRVSEGLGLLYAMHWPYRQFATARGIRRSALHDRFVERNACFGEVAGWERPNWFAPDGVEPRYHYSWFRQNWFDYSAEEHRAVRDGLGLFDQSSFAKFLVQGPDAGSVLNGICANNISVPVGKIVYTQWLNEIGGIEADLTVTRTAEEEFLVVTSAASQVRDFAWLKRHMPEDARAFATDVTSSMAVIGVMGPRSRELLQRVIAKNLSDAAFPFGWSRQVEIGYSPVRASRISYVGELGWELYMPTECGLHVYDALLEACEGLELRHAGMHAMNSLRLEKGYRHWGHDITDEDTPLEAGLGFAVDFDKPDFIGREALLRQRELGVKKRLVQFLLQDPEPLLYHHEPIYRGGSIVGYIASGAYGHSLGASVGLGYVNHEGGVSGDFVESGRYEIEVAGRRFPARASLKPLYDPQGIRLRG